MDTDRLALSVEEAADRLSIGRTQMYVLVRDGKIASVKVGRRRLVPTSALVAYLDRLMGVPT